MAIRKIIKRATDSLFVNTEFDGTEAIKPPVGTTAQRANAAAGDLRFNTTTNLMEYYDGSGWKSIDSPPVVSAVSPSAIANSSSSVDITITGDFFASGATVKAIGQNLSEIAASSVTFTNSTTLVATFNGTSFADAQEDYSIEVTNVSGLTGKGVDLLAVNASPAWTVAAGTLATIYDSARSGISITTGATDDEGESLTYSVTTGSLPSGLSIASSTGTITGSTSAVGSDTTVTFTLSVTDGTNTTTRQYSIIQKAPVITSYTSTGSFTFSVPTGLTAVDVLVVASGGGGGGRAGAGGGAGGLIYRPAFPVTPGGSVAGSVGTAGFGGPGPGGKGNPGTPATFGTLTAQGGGGGGDAGDATTPDAPQISGGRPGGSGGGHGYGQTSSPAGTGTQPQQPGDSGTYGFGNPGGYGSGHPQSAGGAGNDYNPGGGGGAGSAGGQGDGNQSGPGGIGKQYGISGSQVYYAGGGGGGSHAPHGQLASGGQGGGGNGANSGPTAQGGQATANRGGGGGGASTSSGAGGSGGTGGTGIVIVSY